MSTVRVRRWLFMAVAVAAMVASSCGQSARSGHGSAGSGGTEVGADSGTDNGHDAQAEDASETDTSTTGGAGGTVASGGAAGASDSGACGALSEPCCDGATCKSGLNCIVGSPWDCEEVPLGTPCTQNSDCANGDVCVAIGGGMSACTAPCTSAADCIAGWSCASLSGQSSNVCQCTAKSETCDGKDDDCDGVVDDEPLADEVCAQTKGEGYVCQSGTCTCPAMCGGKCVDTNTDSQNCGACGQACAVADPTCSNGQCGACPTSCAADEICGGKSCGSQWAAWPMPNPPVAGLPNPASYDTTSVPGVVIDKVTGLMWQRTADRNAEPTHLSEAESYCANLSLAGYTDWRVPTGIELYSLVDYTRRSPAVDTSAFPDITPSDGASDESFWTSEPVDLAAPDGGWSALDFEVPSFQSILIWGSPEPVRCVRGPARSVNRGNHYTIGDGIVTDNFTHLTWQRFVDPKAYTWGPAQTYCTHLNLAGGGWRVPSVKELATLFDVGVFDPPGVNDPAIDSRAFPNTPAWGFWSSSPYAGRTDIAWAVNFNLVWGSATTPWLETNAVTDLERVRCVR